VQYVLIRALPLETQDELPYNDYFEYYGPDYRLHISPSNMENLNDRSYLDGVIAKLFGALNEIEVAPGVAVQTGAQLDTPAVARAAEHSDNADPDAHDGQCTAHFSDDFVAWICPISLSATWPLLGGCVRYLVCVPFQRVFHVGQFER
jgi:hypothetical protein